MSANKRKAHIITAQKNIQVPRFRVYFDSESRVDEKTLKHKPYLICARFIDARYHKAKDKIYEAENLKSFWYDLIKFGNKTKCRIIAYAHNACYDLIATAGLKELVKAGYNVQGFFEKGICFMLDVKNERLEKTICIISSTNYYPTSLRVLGETFNLQKLDYDYQAGSFDDAKIYCKRDVEILATAMETYIDFIKKEKLGTLGVTTPAQSFNAYRYRFMKHEIYIHDNDKATEIERHAYFGGRTECWKLGTFNDQNKYYKYDVNSMYPFVMKNFNYPVKLVSFRKHLKINEAEYFLKNGYGICAKCLINTKEPVFGLKLNNRLFFPVGEFYTYLSTPEIDYAIKNHMLICLDDAGIYQMKNIFEEYVNYFYTKRLEAKKQKNAVNDMLYKLFMNSLYGKFGQRANKMEKIGEAEPDKVEVVDVIDKEKNERYMLKIFGGGVFRETGEFEEAFNAFCAIASHVTAYARMHLWKYIKKAGVENVYYMDTDSLFVNKQGRENLKDIESHTQLGCMKLEEETDEMVINGPKDYTFAETKKQKGINKDSKKISDNEYLTTQFPKLSSFLRAGNIDEYFNVLRIKKISQKYLKGWVIKTGDVKPFEIFVNENGTNEIIHFDQTSYAHAGLELRDRAQIKDIAKQYKGHFFSEDEAKDQLTIEIWKDEEKEKKKLRKLILQMGGINDKDYKNIPKYLIRKRGVGLDEIAGELSYHGYYCECAEDVYKIIKNL